MSGSLIPNGKQQYLDANGAPLAGGKVYYYIPYTTTAKNTWQDINLTILNTNPIILDSAGECIAWGSGAYRQQIYDVNDNLIWDQYTYGISPAGSNFISQEEVQTATQGQVVFTLSTITYVPGINSLVVFVNGSKQVTGTNYTETAGNTVTFVTGLNAGDVVDFYASLPASAQNMSNALNVAYVPPFPASATTNVQAKLAQYVSVKDFGAVGDGTTDDTTAVQNALNSGALTVIVPANTIVGVTALTLAANQTLQILGGIKKLSGSSPIITMAASSKVVGTGYINGNSVACHGIYSNNVDNLFIEGLYIYSIGDQAIFINNASKYKILNNRIQNTTNQAIDLYFANNGVVTGNYIDTALHGIQWWGGDAATYPVTTITDINISNNTVKNVTAGIWGGCGNRITVTGNTVQTCTDVGIDFEGCKYSTASGNSVSACNNGGISLFFGSQYCSITGNTILNNASTGNTYGIWLTAAANKYNTFSGNVINCTTSQACFYSDTGTGYNVITNNYFNNGICRFLESNNNVISNNYLTDSKLTLEGGSFNLVQGNQIQRVSATDASTQTQSPLYIYWRSISYPAQYNNVTHNTLINWSYCIVDDCYADNASLNDCSYNRVSSTIWHRGTTGWYGRMYQNITIDNPNTAATVSSY